MSLVQTNAVSETIYVKPSLTPEQQKALPKQYYEDRSSGDEPLPNDPTQVQRLAIAQLIYSLLTLIGAVLMFRLRRVGYWIYVTGVVAGLILPIILTDFSAVNLTFGVFFSVLFAGLYWLTLKEMH